MSLPNGLDICGTEAAGPDLDQNLPLLQHRTGNVLKFDFARFQIHSDLHDKFTFLLNKG
jgi:hypothetical protein